jgi:hypothetical protein
MLSYVDDAGDRGKKIKIAAKKTKDHKASFVSEECSLTRLK